MMQNDQRTLLDIPVDTDMNRYKPDNTGKWVDDVVGVFNDPIIVYPGEWSQDLPKWVREAVTMERLLMEMKGLKGERITATDAEVMAYLFCFTLAGPPDYDTAQVYQYVFTKVMRFHKNADLPEDLIVETLTADQERLLSQIKNSIYETRMKYRKGEIREQRMAAREARKQETVEETTKQKEIQHGFDLGI